MNIILKIRRLYFKICNKCNLMINEIRLVYHQITFLELKYPKYNVLKYLITPYQRDGSLLPEYPSDIKWLALLIVNNKSYLREYASTQENTLKARILYKHVVDLRLFIQKGY